MAELTPSHPSSASAEEGGLLPPYPVVACLVIFFWSISIRALLYALMPAIAADLRLSSSVVGVVVASLLLGYCAGMWSAGWIPGSRKARILGGLLLSVVAVGVLSLANDLWGLLVAAPLLGLGLGVYLPLGLGLLVDAGGRRKRARYMSFHEASASLGNFGGPSYVALTLAWIHWHGAILAWTAFGVLALVAVVAMQEDGPRESRRGVGDPVPLDRRLVYSATAFGAVTIVLVGLISLLPLIMVRAWGLDPAYAASIIAYARLVGLGGVAIVGLGADRWGHLRVAMGLQALSLAGGVVMAVSGFGIPFLVGLAVVAVGTSGTITILPLVIAGVYDRTQRDRGMAMASGAGGLVGMVVCPPLFGVLLDSGFASGPILLAVAASLLGILATAKLAALSPRVAR